MDPSREYLIRYAGSEVVVIPGIGKFQEGTQAYVDATTAETARAMGGFVVTRTGEDDGGRAAAAAAPAPVAAVDSGPQTRSGPQPRPEPAADAASETKAETKDVTGAGARDGKDGKDGKAEATAGKAEAKTESRTEAKAASKP